MRKETRTRAGLRYVPLCTAVAVLALSSSVAVAEEATPAGPDGLFQFANVRIVNAPATVTTTGATQSGQRAFRDADTGRLRGPSMEEMQTMAAEPRGRSSGDHSQFYSWHSGVGITLDESFMQYSVIVRQPDGSLAEVCVTGIDKADEITNTTTPVQVTPLKGARDDR